MARMHTRRRGSSASDKPLTDEPPEWSADDAEAVEERIVELSEDGLTAAEIGVELRDNGVKGEPVPDVKLVTGKKITEILEE
ncbi:MAG: 30S ribosomal protein S15, partial [Halobacteria archaeon]